MASPDLQLVCWLDDSDRLSALFDERNPAVTRRIAELLAKAARHHTPVGICGQGPSDHPDFAAFLVRHGISSMSLNPDNVRAVVRCVAAVEAQIDAERDSARLVTA